MGKAAANINHELVTIIKLLSKSMFSFINCKLLHCELSKFMYVQKCRTACWSFWLNVSFCYIDLSMLWRWLKITVETGCSFVSQEENYNSNCCIHWSIWIAVILPCTCVNSHLLWASAVSGTRDRNAPRRPTHERRGSPHLGRAPLVVQCMWQSLEHCCHAMGPM